ncbi:XrtA system polysaccharide chain length determinant [Sphingomonas morindae]|uniref:Chain-length determining protein n=1 Tax=Sphingomonas morindae TaxID=1541170 RepID=A0ABY4X5L5_9SPHN|nr:XrtA system polysaccharide chain length determinant [Sphingomonas morindae]USI72120.1 chain-length determining protein [Sphingomonas morindae]
MQALLEEARIALHLVWRGRWLALGIAWTIALAGWLVVALIPNAYQSTARLYVQPGSILPQAVGISSNDQQAGIDDVRQSLLSDETLGQVVRATDLAREAGSPRDLAAQVARLRKAVDIKTTQDNLYALSVTLSGGGFSDRQNARLAQQVAQALTDRFVSRSSQGDIADAQRSLKFMDQQLAERGAQLQEADAKRAAFEQRYFGALPGSGSIQDRIGLARSQLADLDAQLGAARGAAAAIGGQIAATPATIAGPAAAAGGGSARDRLATLQAQLAADQAQGWTDQHPDVVALRAQIARLRVTAAAEPQGGVSGQPNPAYGSLRAMAAEKSAAAAALAARRAQIQGDLDNFSRLQTEQPQFAAQQAELSRNYDVLKAQYDKLLSDREQVKLRVDAQAQAGTVQVRVIDAPALPRVPAKPKRLLLLSLVLIVAAGAGAGGAWLRARLRTSYATPGALAAASGLPVLGAVGFVTGPRQRAAAARQLRWFLGTGGALLGAYLLLVAAEFVQRGLMA